MFPFVQRGQWITSRCLAIHSLTLSPHACAACLMDTERKSRLCGHSITMRTISVALGQISMWISSGVLRLFRFSKKYKYFRSLFNNLATTAFSFRYCTGSDGASPTEGCAIRSYVQRVNRFVIIGWITIEFVSIELHWFAFAIDVDDYRLPNQILSAIQVNQFGNINDWTSNELQGIRNNHEPLEILVCFFYSQVTT